MRKTENNYAFIDTQNLYLTCKEEGWKIDWKKFIVFLREKYSVQRAYIFIGYTKRNKTLYSTLYRLGYEIIFKEISCFKKKMKGNVDVELAVQAMIDLPRYHGAIIVTNDGDFSYLVKYLLSKQKLKTLLATSKRQSSKILRKTVGQKIQFLSEQKGRLTYKKPLS